MPERPELLLASCPDCMDAPMTMVMCRRHWRKVPRPLQQEVYAAWAARRRDNSPENARRHKDAKDEAIRVAFEDGA